MFFMWFSEHAYQDTFEESPERYRELETEIVRERSPQYLSRPCPLR